jgi:hypothetical protein
MLLVDARALVNLALIAMDLEWARIVGYDTLTDLDTPDATIPSVSLEALRQGGDVSVRSNEEVRPVRALCIPRCCWQLAVQDLFR